MQKKSKRAIISALSNYNSKVMNGSKTDEEGTTTPEEITKDVIPIW